MKYRFVFMADCQIGCYATFSGFDNAAVERYLALGMKVARVPRVTGIEWDADRFREAVELTNGIDPAFAVIGGDLIDDLEDTTQVQAFQEISLGVEGCALRLVAGNHDVAFDATVPSPASIATYRELFGADRYGFTHGPDAFIAVNTTIWTNPQLVPDEHTAQMRFLESSLVTAADARHRVVLGHHPLFVAEPDEPDSYWNIPNPLRSELLGLLDSHSVTAYFAGHWHRNGGGRHGRLEVVVTGPVGVPLGDDPSGLRVVDVGPGGLSHTYMPLTGGS